MDDNDIARKLLIEQTHKELTDKLRQYLVGVIVKGEMIVKKNIDISNGRMFIIPDDKYEELFNER